MFWAARLHTWPDSKRLGVHWPLIPGKLWAGLRGPPVRSVVLLNVLGCRLTYQLGTSWDHCQAYHLRGAASSIIFVATKVLPRLSRQKKCLFVSTKSFACLARQKFCLFVATKVSPVWRDNKIACVARQKFCLFVATKKNACLSRQKFCLFFATKNCLFVANKSFACLSRQKWYL